MGACSVVNQLETSTCMPTQNLKRVRLTDFTLSNARQLFGVQGWHSGESTCLPPICGPGFNSQTQHHMWVEFVGLYTLHRVRAPVLEGETVK